MENSINEILKKNGFEEKPDGTWTCKSGVTFKSSKDAYNSIPERCCSGKYRMTETEMIIQCLVSTYDGEL